MRGSSLRWIALTAVVGLGGLTACGSDDGSGNASGGSSANVVWYTAYSDSVVQSVVEKWQATHPDVRLDAVRLGTTDISARYTGEAQKGVQTVDVITTGDTTMMRISPQYFQNLSKTDLPAIGEYESGNVGKNYVTTNLTLQDLQYNTGKLSGTAVPSSWQGITAADLKGKGIMVDPRAFPAAMSFYRQLQEAYGDGFLRSLGQQHFRVTDSCEPAAQQVAAGGGNLAFPCVPGHSVDLRAQKAPIAIADLKNPPYPAQSHNLAIPAKPAHPKAAKEFAQWLLSSEGQESVCLKVYSTTNTQAKGCIPLPTDGPIKQYDADQISKADQDKIVQLLGLK
jgi:iron(III) transport system substrate-binding protein